LGLEFFKKNNKKMTTVATLSGLSSQSANVVPVSMSVNTRLITYCEKKKEADQMANVPFPATGDPRMTNIFVGDMVAILKTDSDDALRTLSASNGNPSVVACVNGLPFTSEDKLPIYVAEDEKEEEIKNQLLAGNFKYAGQAQSGWGKRTGGASGQLISVALQSFGTNPVAVHRDVRPFMRVYMGIVPEDKSRRLMTNESVKRTAFGILPVNTESVADYAASAVMSWNSAFINKPNGKTGPSIKDNIDDMMSRTHYNFALSKRSERGGRIVLGVLGLLARMELLGMNTSNITEVKKSKSARLSAVMSTKRLSDLTERDIHNDKNDKLIGKLSYADDMDLANNAMQNLASGIAEIIHEDMESIGTVYNIGAPADETNGTIKQVTGFWSSIGK